MTSSDPDSACGGACCPSPGDHLSSLEFPFFADIGLCWQLTKWREKTNEQETHLLPNTCALANKKYQQGFHLRDFHRQRSLSRRENERRSSQSSRERHSNSDIRKIQRKLAFRIILTFDKRHPSACSCGLKIPRRPDPLFGTGGCDQISRRCMLEEAGTRMV